MINLTKEQEEAIEKLKYIDRYFDCNNYYSRYDLDCIEIVLNLIQEQQEDNEKKDKIIDLMAETISAITTGIPTIIKQFEEKYCEFINSDDDCCWKTDKSCKDCIKQYFENQAKM